MRTLPFVAATARGITALITIKLFASTVRLTTADFDITFGGHTWIADAAVNLTQILYAADGTPAGADVRISPDGTFITPGMARRGLLDGRPIKIEICDLDIVGTFDMLPNATIGSAAEDTNGVIVIAAQGPLVLLSGPVTEVHTVTCKAKFGDSRCTVSIAALQSAVVGQALDFFDIQLTTTPSPQPSVLGNIIPQDGPLAGIKIPIRAFDSGTNIVTMFEPFAPSNFPTGTHFLINPGCDKLFATCRDTYANKDNFRGVPYAPGTDFTIGRA